LSFTHGLLTPSTQLKKLSATSNGLACSYNSEYSVVVTKIHDHMIASTATNFIPAYFSFDKIMVHIAIYCAGTLIAISSRTSMVTQKPAAGDKGANSAAADGYVVQ